MTAPVKENKSAVKIKEQKRECEQKRRDKIKNDPQLYEEAKRKERDRYHKRKEEGKLKRIAEPTPIEIRAQREKWALKTAKSRLKKKTEENLKNSQPEISPESGRRGQNEDEQDVQNNNLDPLIGRPGSSRKESGKKIVRSLKCRPSPQLFTVGARCESSEAESLPRGYEKSLNQVSLLGRVGAEPQKRGSEKHPVVIFSLATNIRYDSPGGEPSSKTDWHRISVFKPGLRDTVYMYLRKGQRVYVTGRLSYGEVVDEAGNPRPTTSIIADNVIFFQSNE